LKRTAADFRISESCLTNWLKAADVEDGNKPGTTAGENAESHELKKLIRCSSRRTRSCAGQRPLRWVGVAPIGDAVEEAVQVDQAVLDADTVQGLAGVAAVTGTDPALVVLDVAAGQVRATAHPWAVVTEPAAELAQRVVDLLDGVGPQAEFDLRRRG